MRTVTGAVRFGDAGEGRGTFESVEAFLSTLEAISEETGSTIQAFDADYIAGPDHLSRAVELAERAMHREENVADSLSVEILLYAAGRRQIDRAMTMGVGEETGDVVVLVKGKENGKIGGEDEGNGDAKDAAVRAVREVVDPGEVAPDPDSLREFFDVTEAELAATDADLETLVCERVALLEVRK